MKTHECNVLIVDDAVTIGALQPFPPSVSVTVVNGISAALAKLGVDEKGEVCVAVRDIQHDYDIVLLDFRLRDEDMKYYPMGGLTLHSLFKASFRRSTRRGQCVVCCYSDKMTGEYSKVRYVFELTERKLRNQDGVAGLHQSGIGGIDWPSLYLAKADSVLSEAPYEVFAEIAELNASAIAQKYFWDQPLKLLATYLGVEECSLNQLVVRSGRPDSRLYKWLQQWLWRKSLTISTKGAYLALPKFTHLAAGSEGRQLDRPIHRDRADGALKILPYVDGDRGRCCMAEVLALELEAISSRQVAINPYRDEHAASRCREAKKAFRMVLSEGRRDADNLGYTISELKREDNIGNTFSFADTDYCGLSADNPIYLYVHRSALAAMLNGLVMLMHNHWPCIDDQGRVLCQIRLPAKHRKVMFVVKQQDILTSEAVVKIAESVGSGKQSGLFPALALWGALWIGCENGAVYGASADLAFNLGLEAAVLQQSEIALVFPYETT